jgi:hypothetical protein
LKTPGVSILAGKRYGRQRRVCGTIDGIWSICGFPGRSGSLWSTGLPDVEEPYVDLFAIKPPLLYSGLLQL